MNEANRPSNQRVSFNDGYGAPMLSTRLHQGDEVIVDAKDLVKWMEWSRAEIKRLQKYIHDNERLFAWQALKDDNERLRAALDRIAASHGASDHSCYRRDLANRALEAAPADETTEPLPSQEWIDQQLKEHK